MATPITNATSSKPVHTPQFLRAQAAARKTYGAFTSNHTKLLASALASGEAFAEVKLLLPKELSWGRWCQLEGINKATADGHIRLFQVWKELQPLLTEQEAAEVRFGSVKEVLGFFDRRKSQAAKQEAEVRRKAEEEARLAALTPEERAAEMARMAAEEAERQREVEEEAKRLAEEQAAEAAREGANEAVAAAVRGVLTENLPDEGGGADEGVAAVTQSDSGQVPPNDPAGVGGFFPDEDGDMDDAKVAVLVAEIGTAIRQRRVDLIRVPKGSPLSLKKVDRDTWVRVRE